VAMGAAICTRFLARVGGKGKAAGTLCRVRSRGKGRRKIQYEGVLPQALVCVGCRDVTTRELTPFPH